MSVLCGVAPSTRPLEGTTARVWGKTLLLAWPGPGEQRQARTRLDPLVYQGKPGSCVLGQL